MNSCVSAVLVSRVFYEASRDLDSQPPPRTDRVEACRPQGCMYETSLARMGQGSSPARSQLRAHGGQQGLRPAPTRRRKDAGRVAGGTLLPPAAQAAARECGWHGLSHLRRPRSLRLEHRVATTVIRSPREKQADGRVLAATCG